METPTEFRYEHRHQLDNKGRVSVPAPFREVLRHYDPEEGSVVVTRGVDGPYLVCYQRKAWAELEKAVGSLGINPLTGLKRNNIIRTHIAAAMPLVPDGQGRIVLNKALVEHAGLDNARNVAFLGMFAHFEIWNPELKAEFDQLSLAESGDDPGLILFGDPERKHPEEGESQ